MGPSSAHLSRLALYGRGVRRERSHHRSARDAVMSAPQYGRAFVFGDSVNTDALAPGGLMKHPIAVIASHCLESVDPSFASTVRPGDMVVAGKGFGIGSSREQAAEALKHLGVAAVLARSFGGIFYRNALNSGPCAGAQHGSGSAPAICPCRCGDRRDRQQDARNHTGSVAAAVPAGDDRGWRAGAASREALRRQACGRSILTPICLMRLNCGHDMTSATLPSDVIVACGHQRKPRNHLQAG